MGIRFAVISPIIFPFRVTCRASPRSAVHRHGHAQECAHVRNGPVQFLEVHVQRLALRTAWLLVQPYALHVKTFENGLIENLPRVLYVLDLYIEFDSSNEVRNE